VVLKPQIFLDSKNDMEAIKAKVAKYKQECDNAKQQAEDAELSKKETENRCDEVSLLIILFTLILLVNINFS